MFAAKGPLGERTRQPQIIPTWTWVPPASRGHMLLMVLSTWVLPDEEVTSVSGSSGTGQPWLGPVKLPHFATTWPWVSVVLLWALTVAEVQELFELGAHHSGYQLGQLDGSV